MKENFRPVSILPTLSKIFKKYMFTKMSTQMSNGYSIKFFRINNAVNEMKSIQYSTLPSGNIGNMERSVDKGEVFGALLKDLSKAFDSLDHELLTAKLKACLHYDSLTIIYQTENREQKLRILTVLG